MKKKNKSFYIKKEKKWVDFFFEENVGYFSRKDK